MPGVRVLLADPHPVVLDGLRLHLERATEFEIVAETRTGTETIEKTLALVPHLLILELVFPDLPGTRVLRALQEQKSSTRALVFSEQSSDKHVRLALEAGASGYLSKENSLESLPLVLRTIQAGGRYLNSTLKSPIIQGHSRAMHPAAKFLTGQEVRILELLAQEKSSKEIAAELHISPRTVDAHRASVMKKLGIHSAIGLVRYAVRVGLVSEE